MMREGEPDDRKAAWTAFLLPIVFLLPFVMKSYHADDLLFVWVVEQIMRAPLDFYGFSIDYGYTQTPIHEVFHNLPGVSYYLALFGVVFGGGEMVYHFAMLLPAGLAGLGIYLLARDLAPNPSVATLAAILTPAFLVSGSTLMSDLPVMAAFTWAVYYWRRGMREERGRDLLIASLVISAGILLKYYAVTLIPLLLVYGLLIRRRMGGWCIYLIVPIAVLGTVQGITYALYGITTFTDAAGIALSSTWRTEEGPLTRPILTLVFLGGCFAPLALFLPYRESWRLYTGLLAIVAFLSVPVAEGYSVLELMLGGSEPLAWSRLAWMGLLMWLGACLLVQAALAIYRQRDADAALLGLWIFGTVVFTAWINHYVNARAILPLLPAIAIVATRRFALDARVAWRLLPAAGLCLWTMVGDYDAAAHGKRAAAEALDHAREEGSQLHHIAFWGSEYYLIAGGSTAFAFEEQEEFEQTAKPRMETGDVLFVHSLGVETWATPPRGFEIVRELAYPYRVGLTTFDAAAGAGFYSHRTGHLPYVMGRVAPARYLVLRWNGSEVED